MENRWLESAVEAYKKHFGNTANTIIDVGTRDGNDAEYFREKLNGTNIYVFDANPIAIEITKNRYPNFNVIESAVSNYNGNTVFTQIVSNNKDLEGCSSFINIHNVDERGSWIDIDVSVTRLDSFFNKNNLNIIDIIKVDTEGFSFEVLEGMGDTIHNVKLFHLETETFDRHPGHKNNLKIKQFMIDKDFTLVDVSYEWGPKVEDQVWINNKLV